MAPHLIDTVVTQLPEFVEGSDPDAYAPSVVQAIEMLKPWMHQLCRIWIRAKDAYRLVENSANPEYKHPELLGLPWRVALALKFRGFHLYTCIALKSKDWMLDHEYLFLLRATTLPHSVESHHRKEWPQEGEDWLQWIVDSSQVMTCFYDPYQNPKIKEFVKKNGRRWLGEE